MPIRASGSPANAALAFDGVSADARKARIQIQTETLPNRRKDPALSGGCCQIATYPPRLRSLGWGRQRSSSAFVPASELTLDSAVEAEIAKSERRRARKSLAQHIAEGGVLGRAPTIESKSRGDGRSSHDRSSAPGKILRSGPLMAGTRRSHPAAANYASSNSIFLASRSSAAMRKLRICPA